MDDSLTLIPGQCSVVATVILFKFLKLHKSTNYSQKALASRCALSFHMLMKVKISFEMISGQFANIIDS